MIQCDPIIMIIKYHNNNNNNNNKRFIIQVINNTVQGHKQSKAMYKLPCPLIS